MARLTRSRPLQIGAISAHGDELLAVDELLPIAVVFSAAGDVQAAHTWELSPTERAGNRVNSVLLTTEEILIISPAAGGVVRIDRRSGVSDTIALDPPPWFIVAAGDTVWLGDSAYDGYYLNEPTPTPPHTVSYPVIWEEDVEVEKDPARQFPEWGPWPRLVKKKGPRPSDSIGRQAVLEVSSSGHLWRLRGDRAEPVDLGGVVGTAYGSPHGLLLTCRTPDDPMIRERSHGPEGGARHVARSESVLLVQHDGTFEVIAKVRSVDRFVPAGNGCALFAGFETEDKTLRLLDFDHRRFGEPLPYEREENTYPQLIDGDRLVSFNHRTATLSLTPIDGGESRAVVLPGERAIRDQLGDWDAAISCAGELPDVDPERLAIWSFSASGGHVLLVAARHPAVAAAIAQTPNASGRAAARNASRHQRLPALMRLSGRGILDAAGGFIGLAPRLVPLAGKPGDVAVVTTPDALDGDRALNPDNRYPDWQQAVAARSALRLGFYEPGRAALRAHCSWSCATTTRQHWFGPRSEWPSGRPEPN